MPSAVAIDVPPVDDARRSDLVVVANRLPVHRVGDQWATSPGGLVRAMMGVLSGRKGSWVGWNGDTIEPAQDPHTFGPDLAEAGDLHDLDGIELVAVPLSSDEFLHHYERISNGALWPLFHDAIRDSIFDPESWAVYREVNARFAAAAAGAAAPGATIWIHDYHLLLMPAMLRTLRPDVSIGFFLHIPFPPQELFMRMPWREEILDGLVGADLLGFQRSVGADNFVAIAKRLLGAAESDADPDVLVLPNGRTVRVGTFPISIDSGEIASMSHQSDIPERVRRLRNRLGNPAAIFLGVDRLDYTKGIDLRLASFGDLLRRRSKGVPENPDVVLVQIAVPGREGVDSYVEERQTIERLVGEVNGE
ncbi:MAG: trehalose-6-phosphate synthase, partial [Ilumatobacteraceae bacterium]